MAIRPTEHLITVDEYYRMAEDGRIHEDDRVELLDGEIVAMGPIGPRHAYRVRKLTLLFVDLFRDRADIDVQSPVRLGIRAEPEPDLALSHPRSGSGALAHPTPSDTLLIVEVADSSLAFDLGSKARLYARYDIRELWVLDLLGDRVVVHRSPTAHGYADVRSLHSGDLVSPLAFPEVVLGVDDLFR